MYTLGINLSHHSSVALLKDNQVVFFVLEERLNRKKYCKAIPFKSLHFIQKFTNTIDVLITCHADSKQSVETIIKTLNNAGVTVKRATNNNTAHHLYHAAAGFYMSHYEQASCLVVDGAGSIRTFRQSDNVRASETTSIFEARYPAIFECKYKNFTVGLYDSNFNFNMEDLSVNIEVTDDEIAAFKQKVTKNNRVDVSTDTDIGFKYTIVSHKIGFPKMGGEGKTMGLSAYGSRGSDWRAIEAYQIQKELEKIFVERAEMCSGDSIVLSGGCALNILGNSVIKKTFPNKNIYIDPVATDATIALGAAAHYFYKTTRCQDKLIFNPYVGPPNELNKPFIYELTRKYSI